MKAKKFSIFRRITILVFTLILVLAILFVGLTYYATNHYHLASTQLLNKDVAGHIAEFSSPYDGTEINKSKADSVFKNVMVISPSAEVYFLDTTGKVLDFYGSKKEVKLWQVSLKNIDKYIAAKGQDYIKAPDPRDPSYPKIFSAAAVTDKTKKLGYIYVILGSNEYRAVGDMLFGSHISSLAIKAFVFIILLSVILSILYIKRIEKSFGRMINVLQRFENGDINARFKTKDNDELAPVSRAFNKMADMLIYNTNKLLISEKERKEFIVNIAHDLRTPLTIARGYAETLQIKKQKDELTNNEQYNYMQIILKKVLQVQHMVEHLFEISKMEAAEYKPQKEPFVLSEIVQEIVNIFQLKATEKKILLKCDQCHYLVWINADINLLERAIQNLIDNAIKNTPENGKIEVALQVENNDLIFYIENTGTPLSEGFLKWLNSSEIYLNEHYSGTEKSGLGLIIVKKILALHNSALTASAQNDTGNIFSFRLDIYNPITGA